jgi:hypothetical protein
MVRRPSLFANLAYLMFVCLLAAGGWYGARAWFEGWRIDIEIN